MSQRAFDDSLNKYFDSHEPKDVIAMGKPVGLWSWIVVSAVILIASFWLYVMAAEVINVKDQMGVMTDRMDAMTMICIQSVKGGADEYGYSNPNVWGQ